MSGMSQQIGTCPYFPESWPYTKKDFLVFFHQSLDSRGLEVIMVHVIQSPSYSENTAHIGGFLALKNPFTLTYIWKFHFLLFYRMLQIELPGSRIKS